jgi:hypothetical protein
VLSCPKQFGGDFEGDEGQSPGEPGASSDAAGDLRALDANTWGPLPGVALAFGAQAPRRVITS